ncbi:MAG: hypothetical protein QM692_04510 [Thermomicrobiales bacterium]
MVEPQPWRYVRFFFFLPWPISAPTGIFHCPIRQTHDHHTTHDVDVLAELMPRPLAEDIARDASAAFVFLQFHRRPTTLTRWIQYYFEAERAANAWEDFYRLRGALPAGYTPWYHGPADPLDSYGTFIEATTALPEYDHLQRHLVIEEALDSCLRECEVFIEGYAHATNDLRIGFCNRATILPIVPAVLMDPITHRAETLPGIPVNQEGAYPTDPPPDLTLQQAQAIAHRSQLSDLGHPWLIVEHWRRLAFRALHAEGDFAASIVSAHTAGEVFFDSLLLSLAWEEIRTFRGSCLVENHVVGWFRDLLLPRRLRSQYARRLHGGWDADQPGNPVYEFTKCVSHVRHKVVHAGYRPTMAEAQAAFTAFETVGTYAVDILAHQRNRTRYPLTLALIAGVPRMEERGIYTGQTRRAIETARPGWQRDFYQFRQRVIQAAIR